MVEKWPNFFIVGAPKSGTSSLYEYLKVISGIYMSPVKEPKYFSTKMMLVDRSFDFISDKQEYLNLFKDAKILISLRNPISRAFSHYLMDQRIRNIESSFSDVIQGNCEKYLYFRIIERSLYYESVKRFIDIFGKENVKVIIFEEWVKDPLTAIKEILNFLDISHTITEFNPKIFNSYAEPRGKIGRLIYQNKTIRKFAEKNIPSTIRKSLKEKFVLKSIEKPSIEPQQVEFLANFYRGDVKKLKKLLNQNPNWRNFDND